MLECWNAGMLTPVKSASLAFGISRGKDAGIGSAEGQGLEEGEGDWLSQVESKKKGKPGLDGFPFTEFGIFGWRGSVVLEHLVDALGVE